MEAFYQIIDTQCKQEKLQVTVQVNPEHPIYKGHFPGHPITPGAMLVRMAIEVVSVQCELTQDANEVKNVKFLHPHYPLEQQYLTFVFDAQHRPLEVTICQDEVIYAKMTLIF